MRRPGLYDGPPAHQGEAGAAKWCIGSDTGKLNFSLPLAEQPPSPGAGFVASPGTRRAPCRTREAATRLAFPTTSSGSG